MLVKLFIGKLVILHDVRLICSSNPRSGHWYGLVFEILLALFCNLL